MSKIFSREIWSEILYSLKRNKRRTFITSLGIFFGMFFFVLLDGIGTGIGNSISDGFSPISSKMVGIFGGRTTMPYQGYKADREIELNYRDYLYMSSRFRTLGALGVYANISKISDWSDTNVSANNKSSAVGVYGISPDHPYEVRPTVAIAGRLMTKQELAGGAAVCTIGSDLVLDFFDSPEEAVGHFLTVNGLALRIVGVTEQSTDNFNVGYNVKDAVEMPISYAVGNDPERRVIMLGILSEGATVNDFRNEMMAYNATAHHIDPRDTDAIGIMDMESQLKVFDLIIDLLNALVWIIGLGTLFTGVISVSNILLVTVKERQREIGVRRAIGAKPMDIVLQFMLEAVTMIFISGLIGLTVGTVLLIGIGLLAEAIPMMGAFIARPYPTIGKLILSLSIMIVAGIVAGLLPVQKALGVKAIDAIRDE